MQDCGLIPPPCGDDDTAGARRVFGEFVVLYHPLLLRMEDQLDVVVTGIDPRFAEGYRPWQNALHELLSGAYSIAKDSPPPHPRRFNEALLMFSLRSAADLLQNICMNSRLHISRRWTEEFQEHINLLLFSLSILNQDTQNTEKYH